MYGLRKTRNRIKIGKEFSKIIWSERGIRQECPLSPKLFNLVTADLKEMKKEEWRRVRLRESRYILAYADNIMPLAKEKKR